MQPSEWPAHDHCSRPGQHDDERAERRQHIDDDVPHGRGPSSRVNTNVPVPASTVRVSGTIKYMLGAKATDRQSKVRTTMAPASSMPKSRAGPSPREPI